jgi:hypothetical protein
MARLAPAGASGWRLDVDGHTAGLPIANLKTLDRPIRPASRRQNNIDRVRIEGAVYIRFRGSRRPGRVRMKNGADLPTRRFNLEHGVDLLEGVHVIVGTAVMRIFDQIDALDIRSRAGEDTACFLWPVALHMVEHSLLVFGAHCQMADHRIHGRPPAIETFVVKKATL